MGFDRVTASTAYLEIARHYRALQPGWFPLGPLPLALWLADPPERIVKMLQFVLVVLTFATFGTLARRLFGSIQAAVVATVIVLTSWQLRMPHDPVIGTSFTTPVLAEWVLLAYACWLAYFTTRKAAWLAGSCFTMAFAMLTDPLSWGFAAFLVALALLDREGNRLRLAWPATALAVVIVASVLGLPHAPWQRNGSYMKDVAAQIAAPLPATYRAFGSLHIHGTAAFWHGSAYVDDRFVAVPSVDAWAWMQIFALMLAAFVALGAMPAKAEARRLRTALYLGLGFWLIPALVLGPGGVWQSGMPLGQSFDGVYLQYFGIGILFTAALARLRQRAGPVAMLAPTLLALAVMLLCYGNVRTNAAAISKTHRSAASIAQIERAGAADFFSVLPTDRTLAVASSEPFANGIHSSVSDAKYAIYHYAKRRFRIIALSRLRQTPGVDAWVLRTPRASGIFVSLDHVSRSDGRLLLSDRAFGFSAIASVQDTLSVSARGVILATWPLKDGFAIRARRTCGPVAPDLVYAGAEPTFSWGPGFYHHGPVGYASDSVRPETDMFMTATGELVIRPTTCSPRALVFQATVQTTGASTLVTNVHGSLQRLFITSTAPLIVHTPVSRYPTTIDFLTDAPPADWDPIASRYERDRPRDLRLRFFSASVVEDAAPAPHRDSARGRS